MASQKPSNADFVFPELDFTVETGEREEPKTLRARTKRAYPPPPTKSGRPRATSGPSKGEGLDWSTDPEVEAIRLALIKEDPGGARISYALREALDQVYDGRRTGRWDFTQLSKTEKTHIGTLVEIWLQREFEFEDGDELDFKIAGVDVDCKWSMNLYSWEIPMEMYSRGDKIAMLVWGNEDSARWALGLLRISDQMLRPLGKQRDRKRRLSEKGKRSITWVFRDMPMIQNTLVHHPEIAERMRNARSGQQAVRTIFREIQGELINHSTIETAGQQVDSSKRVRDARSALRKEGIIILGHYEPHPYIAKELGIPAPTLGRFVSAAVAPVDGPHDGKAVEIDGRLWRIANRDDDLGMAPVLPSQGAILSG